MASTAGDGGGGAGRPSKPRDPDGGSREEEVLAGTIYVSMEGDKWITKTEIAGQ